MAKAKQKTTAKAETAVKASPLKVGRLGKSKAPKAAPSRPIITTTVTSEYSPTDFRSAGSLKPESIEWLLPGRLMRRAINLIDAHKSMGKSSFLASVVAAYSRGKDLEGNYLKNFDRPNILWIQHEEVYAADVVPRLKAANADLVPILVPETVAAILRVSLPANLEGLAKLVKNSGVGLVIVDPFSALSDGTADENHQQGMRRYMECMKAACVDNGATVICSRHLRKGSSGRAAEQGMGSNAIAAVARVLLRIDENPKDKAQRLLTVLCSSQRKPLPVVLEQVEPSSNFSPVRLGGELDLTIEEILEGSQEQGQADESQDAATIMFELLKGGPMWSKDLLSAAKDSGVSERTMRKAKAAHKIPSMRKFSEDTGTFKLYWCLPGQSDGSQNSVAELQP